MIVLLDLVVGVRLPELKGLDDAELLEQGQGAVDGGEADSGPLFTGDSIDLRRIEVGVSVDDADEKLPLRGDAASGRSKPFDRVVSGAHAPNLRWRRGRRCREPPARP